MNELKICAGNAGEYGPSWSQYVAPVGHMHTPGPWTVGGHPRDKSGTGWREILHDSPYGPAYLGQALEADAHLIAAAPDMLAALLLLVNGDGQPDECLRVMALARAAIAKATP